MPPFVRATRAGLILWFGFLSLYFAWRLHVDASPITIAMSLLYALAAIGLARGVVWGRALATIGQLLVMLIACTLFMGDTDSDGGVLAVERLLRYVLPVWAQWLLLMFSVLVLLTPLVIVGWRRDWHRRGIW